MAAILAGPFPRDTSQEIRWLQFGVVLLRPARCEHRQQARRERRATARFMSRERTSWERNVGQIVGGTVKVTPKTRSIPDDVEHVGASGRADAPRRAPYVRSLAAVLGSTFTTANHGGDCSVVQSGCPKSVGLCLLVGAGLGTQCGTDREPF